MQLDIVPYNQIIFGNPWGSYGCVIELTKILRLLWHLLKPYQTGKINPTRLLLFKNRLSFAHLKNENCCWIFFPSMSVVSPHLRDFLEKLNAIACKLVLFTLEDYLQATDLLPALIFIFMARLFGFLSSSSSRAVTKVVREKWGLCFLPLWLQHTGK